MFEYERYIQIPLALGQYRNGPYAAERDSYLSHLAADGRAKQTMLLIMVQLRFAAAHLDLAHERSLNRREVARQLRKGWLRRGHARHRTTRRREQAWRLCLNHVIDWLRFIRRFREPPAIKPAFEPLLSQYVTFCHEERGLAKATLENVCGTAQLFFRHLAAINRPLSAATNADVASFLSAGKARGWCHESLCQAASNLRSFLRFAAQRNWVCAKIPEAICIPRRYRHATLPLGPRWDQVRQLIASARGTSAKDVRDLAILLLLATYGFRAGEVVALQLEDVDWEANVIRPRRPKSRRTGVYPLAQPVGQAILRYLQKVRPSGCKCRNLFMSRWQPYRPISSVVITEMVRKRQLRLGQQLERYGAHGLRHACATHLLAEGFTFKQIGDQLGHTSPVATGIYAKVDLAGLREVASLDMKPLVRHDRQCEAREAGLWPRGSLEALREVADVPIRELVPFALPLGTRA